MTRMHRISGFWFLIFFILVIVNHILLTECSFMGKSLRRRIFAVVDDDTAASHLRRRRRRRQFSRSPFRFRILFVRGGSDSYSDNEEDYRILGEDEDMDFGEDGEQLPLSFSSDDEDDEYDTVPLSSSSSSNIQDSNMDDTASEENVNVNTNVDDDDDDENDISSSGSGSVRASPSSEVSMEGRGRKENRHTSDIILELDRRSSVSSNDESLTLRQLITSRTQDYIYELQETAAQLESDDATINNNANIKLPHPRSLLHYLAKNVPAIKQSPDVNLRIHSSRSDIDPGVAACIIGRLAFACEQYDQVQKRSTQIDNTNGIVDDEDSDNKNSKLESAAPQLTADRRFEQLVECVISGVNIKKRKEESLQRQLDKSSDEIVTNIEEVLDEENARFDEGLNIRDACRAAWGIAILGAHYLDDMGGAKVKDLFLALSLGVRELLLARLQELRQGDILSSGEDGMRLMTTEERLNEMAEELAEDAASAMWAFGCVRACTGITSAPLFEACCSILCQDPIDLRRRAQEAEYEPSKDTIGISDVVDRLARSEAAAEEEYKATDIRGTATNTNESLYNTEKDAFLDWLSPIEVTDILWALALHGSNVTSSMDDEVTLSETASTLRETAYDRLVEWLEEDIGDNKGLQTKSNLEPASEIESNEEVILVEVVDAATLLASEDESTMSDNVEENKPVPTESIAMKTNAIVSSDRDSQEVEVVDAAKLLASIDSEEKGANVETEVMIAPTSVIEGNSKNSKSTTDDGFSLDRGVDVANSIDGNSSPRIFSPHDLASIAWSVTELRDPLRTHIVGLVIELLWRLGPEGVSGLSGTDLSNLAWAIAKYEGGNHDAYSVAITRWIADHTLQRTRKYPLLSIVTPPELGRIMWAIACLTSTKDLTLNDIGIDTSSFFLTRKAIISAADNISSFSTETLVRIAWAHLEINDSNLSVLDTSEMLALGKVLATAEHSLHRWERVDFATGDAASTESHVDSPLFSSFFGRPRRNLAILEQAVNDDDDEDDIVLAPLGRSQRPKLRDLMIDPSTLCKAACSFQRLSTKHPYIKGGWAFTRVAVRLLSSKNARLMKECSIHDIVRLCEAAVLSDVDGHGRELIIGLFARQVVKVLNEVLEGENQHDTSINIGSASSSEISTLIWALGEMGVKCSSAGHSEQSSNKKMRLIFTEPLLDCIQVESLDIVALERLIRGLVLMKMTFSSDQPFLLRVLTRISKQIPGITTGNDLCSLAVTIGILKEASKTSPEKKEVYNEEEVPSETIKEDETSLSQIKDPDNISSVQEQLSSRSDDVLDSIAEIATELSKQLTANEIRRLLEVYSLLPFQADTLVDCLSEEVSNRLTALRDLQRTQTLDVLLKDASRKSSVVRSSLFDDSNASLFGSIKAGIRSFFGSTNDEQQEADQIDDEGTKMTEEIASIIQDSISASSDAASRAEADQSALQISLDNVIQTLQEEASFELGRSQELVENYHRTEFTTGKRRSRYDKDRKNYISKRVLSRLLP